MNRNLAPIAGALYRSVKMLSGRLDITAAGAGAATTSVFVGGVATPFVRTGVGVFTLTLSEPVVGPVFPLLTMKKATAENLDCEVSAEDLAGQTATKVLTIRTVLSSTGAAADAANACSVYIHLILPDSQAN